jgi:ribulose bisphosphate carboxylase small subunit
VPRFFIQGMFYSYCSNLFPIVTNTLSWETGKETKSESKQSILRKVSKVQNENDYKPYIRYTKLDFKVILTFYVFIIYSYFT